MKCVAIERQTWVRFYRCDQSRTKDAKVQNREPGGLEFPSHCIAFQFFDTDVVRYCREEGGEEFTLESEPYEVSPKYYRKGRKLTPEEFKALLPLETRLVVAMVSEMPSFLVAPIQGAEIYCPDAGKRVALLTIHPTDVILEEVAPEQEKTEQEPEAAAATAE